MSVDNVRGGDFGPAFQGVVDVVVVPGDVSIPLRGFYAEEGDARGVEAVAARVEGFQHGEVDQFPAAFGGGVAVFGEVVIEEVGQFHDDRGVHAPAHPCGEVVGSCEVFTDPGRECVLGDDIPSTRYSGEEACRLCRGL